MKTDVIETLRGIKDAAMTQAGGGLNFNADHVTQLVNDHLVFPVVGRLSITPEGCCAIEDHDKAVYEAMIVAARKRLTERQER